MRNLDVASFGTIASTLAAEATWVTVRQRYADAVRGAGCDDVSRLWAHRRI
jgi:hypothetical protein